MDTRKAVIKSNSIFGFRHVQALLLFTGVLLSFCMRSCLSLAIVAMTDEDVENTFDWPLSTQNVIMSSFNWGFIVLLAPGGELARRFGGKPLVAFSIAINSVVSLILPVSAIYGGWKATIACRVIQGLGASVQLPALIELISKWSPLEEKGRMASFIFSGGQLGIAIQLLTGGYIADIWSWPGIFYVDGVVGIIWTVIYMILGSSSPQTSKYIKEDERFYIQNSLQQIGELKKLKTPWKPILTSLPFWALIISCAGFNWGNFTLLTQIPTYISRVLDVDIKSNGVLSAVPYISFYVLCYPFGYFSDFILKKKWLSVTACRKLFNSIALFGPAVTLIALCFAPASTAVYITLLSFSVGLCAGFFSGDALVYLDMAPNFASVLMGIAHFIGSAVALNAPLAVNLFIKSDDEPKEWHNVFYLTAGIFVVTNTVFLIFGTSERQWWNNPDEIVKETMEDTEKC